MALKTLRPAGTSAAPAPTTPNPAAAGDIAAQIAALQAQAEALKAQQPPPPATAPVEAVAVPDPPAPAAVAVAGNVNPLLDLFAQKGLTVSSAGAASRAVTKTGGGRDLVFPTIDVTSGNTGGAFAANDRNPADILRVLPQGRVPLFGLFLAYRYEATGWPCDFDHKGEDTRPLWECVIPSADDATADLLSSYGEAYQYTAKDARPAMFDPPGPGHLRPSFQALVYLPPMIAQIAGQPVWGGGLVVVRTPYHSMSVSRSADSIVRHTDPQSNSIPPFACQFEVRTNQETNKAGTFSWKIHHLDFQALPFPGPQAEAVLTAFRDWFIRLDDATKQTYNAWVEGKDAPITPVALAALQKGAALRRR